MKSATLFACALLASLGCRHTAHRCNDPKREPCSRDERAISFSKFDLRRPATHNEPFTPVVTMVVTPGRIPTAGTQEPARVEVTLRVKDFTYPANVQLSDPMNVSLPAFEPGAVEKVTITVTWDAFKKVTVPALSKMKTELLYYYNSNPKPNPTGLFRVDEVKGELPTTSRSRSGRARL